MKRHFPALTLSYWDPCFELPSRWTDSAINSETSKKPFRPYTVGSTVSGGTKLHKYLEIPTEIGRQTKNDNGDHEIQIPQNIKTKKSSW